MFVPGCCLLVSVKADTAALQFSTSLPPIMAAQQTANCRGLLLAVASKQVWEEKKKHGVIIQHERLKQRGQDGELDSRYLQNRTAGVFGKIDLPAVCWTQGKLENFDSKVAKSRFWTSGF